MYVNYLGIEGEDRVKAAYETSYERLVSLKNKYDPMNLFHFNQKGGGRTTTASRLASSLRIREYSSPQKD